MDGCSLDNLDLSAAAGVWRDDQSVVGIAFGYFLAHQLIIFAELMVVYEGLGSCYSTQLFCA